VETLLIATLHQVQPLCQAHFTPSEQSICIPSRIWVHNKLCLLTSEERYLINYYNDSVTHSPMSLSTSCSPSFTLASWDLAAVPPPPAASGFFRWEGEGREASSAEISCGLAS